MIITAPRVITALPDAPVLEPGYVVTAGNRIAGVGQDRPPGPPDLELDAGVLVPGLVDLQVNGYFGVEMQAADPAGWATVIERLPATGCTAFLPTFITAPVRQLADALGCVREYCRQPESGGARGCSACIWKGRSSRRAGGGAQPGLDRAAGACRAG